jgi:hypothetical protein
MSDRTHFPILAAAVAHTTGPVLELGCGAGSTIMLHYMCAGKRLLVTAETDRKWLRKFTDYATVNTSERLHDHWLKYVEDWDKFDIIEGFQWGMAFVDCAPGEARARLVERLKGRAHFIVVHDTELDSGGNYGFEPVFKTFKYRSEWRRWRPYTSVVSDEELFLIHDVDKGYDEARWLGNA